ncbi:MAG: molybdopterin dinucleotide binding domain-containing protein, partial [Jatrophihabitans sp.]
KLAWVPRRAGERGAVDAGALPTLLPGGRPVADAAARAEVAGVWGADLPTQAGLDLMGILRSAADGALSALVVGAVDPADTPDPVLAEQALSTAGFIVSLEIRHSAVTDHADVVLPVAPMAEKAGRYVTWEGRRRPFELTIKGTGAMPDARVLNALAEEMDVDLGLPSLDAVRAELLRFAPATERPAGPNVKGTAPEPPGEGEALLATWHELIDAGRMQDGDENLAGTAKPVFARISANTAAEIGLAAGDLISVSTERGTVVLPTQFEAMPDRVVWLPTNARECAVRAGLGAVAGSRVTLGRADAPPVVGVNEGEAE